MCLCVRSDMFYVINLHVCTVHVILPLSFLTARVWLRENVLCSTDVLMHSCARREPCIDAVFCVCWLELRQTHSDTSRPCSCSLSTSLRLCMLPRLCWKRMGDKLGPSGDPTLLINTVHWQGAPVRSKIKYIWKGETESERMGWTKKKTHSKRQLLHLGLKSIEDPRWVNNPPQIHCDQALWMLPFDDVFLQMAGYLEYFSIPVFAFLACIHWIFVIVMCLQESTVIMCAHKASGDPTVQSAAPVRTEDPVLQRTAHVCVHLDTEGPPAKEVSLVLFLPATSVYPNL